MDFREIDQKLRVYDQYLENAEDSEMREDLRYKKNELAKKVIEMCESAIDRATALYESGKLSKADAQEIIDSMEEKRQNLIPDACPAYMESVEAAALSLAVNEVQKLSKSNNFAKSLMKPEVSYIMGRLKRYTLLHEDAVAFTQLTPQTYRFTEIADTKLGKPFKYAPVWFKANQQIATRIYTYNNKPVCAIAFTAENNSDIVFYESSFKKHADYYAACMLAKAHIGDPTIKRVLEKLKAEWKSYVKTTRNHITESVEEAIAEGRYEEKILAFQEAAQEGFVRDEDYNMYLAEMRQAAVRNIG